MAHTISTALNAFNAPKGSKLNILFKGAISTLQIKGVFVYCPAKTWPGPSPLGP